MWKQIQAAYDPDFTELFTERCYFAKYATRFVHDREVFEYTNVFGEIGISVESSMLQKSTIWELIGGSLGP